MLYIYSGEVPELDQALRQALGSRHRLTIIPASLRDAAAARQVAEYFRHQGFHARLPGARYFRDRRRLASVIMNSDAVYLCGGNTFEFLAYARHTGLFALLAEFERRGGVIAAESAGSIILSLDVATALIPTTCPDEEHALLDSHAGMGRIPFHISPHFDPAADCAARELHELQALASYSGVPVMVLRDGEGMILDGQDIVTVCGTPQRLDPGQPAMPALREILPRWAVAGEGAAAPP